MTRKILFVDDEPLIVETFRRLLEERYEIETATSPEEGLRILRGSGPFAVVVSDLRMPEMSGTDFLGKVRQGWPDTVGVMLTGYADLDTTIRILSEGKIFRFLTKPCPREQIILTVEAALAHHRLVVAERDLLGVTLPGLLGAIARDLEKAAGSRPGR
ncbi:MAG: response regulator, partial [Candidatus Eisenbacteria bacterium]|nr:response regulator [Candidatus Eisenbacteria bacterium]